jgi:hypothetical protein
MASTDDTPLRALTRGVLAGATGTAAMTAAQTAYYKATGAESSTTPAEVAKRIVRGVLQRDVSEDRTETLNTAMHWLYGTSWGALYGLAARRPTLGVVFGTVVWGASLVELPAMKLAPPVWEMPPSSIGPDLGFHLVYGTAVAAAHRVLS